MRDPRPLQLPAPLQGYVERAAGEWLSPGRGQRVDFTRPAGEPALTAPDSLSWRIFHNPVTLFIGGVAAVILELAEPRVRAGVWNHTSFRTDPVTRLKRTGFAAMATVYGPRSAAEAMIAGIRRGHDRIRGVTPQGEAYHANDPELLRWVQATAAFGFMEAYHLWARPLTTAERDRAFAEGAPAARLYGASGAPSSEAEWIALLERMTPRLESSDTLFEFLGIMGRAPILPAALRPAQRMLLRAAIATVPEGSARRLGLQSFQLRRWEAPLVRRAGRLAERVLIKSSPAIQSCRRLGLPADHLFR